MPSEDHTTRGQRIAQIALGLFLVGLGIWTIQGFLTAIAWASIIAIALWPLYTRPEWQQLRRPRHNILMPSLFTTVVALVLLAPLVIIGVQISREVQDTISWIQTARLNGIPEPIWLTKFPFGQDAINSWWQTNLSDPSGSADLLNRIDRKSLVAFGEHLGSKIVHHIITMGITLLTLFFLFREGKSITEQMRQVGRLIFGPHGEEIGLHIIASVRGTVNGLVLVGLGEGTLLGVIYAIAGVPHATLFAMAIAMLSTVPLAIGIPFGIASLTLLVNGAIAKAIAVLSISVVVSFTADHFVRPKLISGTTRLPFLWVLLGILGGIEVWGLIGLFIGPAIMSALMMTWRSLAKPKVIIQEHEAITQNQEIIVD
jgi:predicted PurR-regulated permease PerM